MKNKKLYLLTSIFLCSSCSIVNLFTPKAKVLKEPVAFRNSIKKTANFDELAQNVRDFSANFSVESSKELDDKKANNVVSPLSMFSALVVASGCSRGNTKQELLSTLKTTDSLLQNEFANLYSDSNYTSSIGSDNKVVKKEELTNSIWLDKNIKFNESVLEKIAEYFYCYSLSVDFKNQNKKANRQMSKFVEEKTNGLIAPNFDFDTLTRFTILNTLYLKSLWNKYSDDLATSDEKFTFTNRDGSTKNINLFMSEYEVGRTYKGENYSSFFAETERGDRIKFIVPNDGVNLEDLITPEVISNVNNQKYVGVDEENKIMYHTKTYFPGFEAETKIDAKDILKKMGVNDLFTSACDFSGFLDEFVYCDEIQHVAKLKVDKKGIEGAAYTAINMKGEAGPLDGYEDVFEEFVVDRSFFYVISDHNNLPVFSGIVNKI
jgi:serine protease inhibitor